MYYLLSAFRRFSCQRRGEKSVDLSKQFKVGGYVSTDCQPTKDHVKLGFSTQKSYKVICNEVLRQAYVSLITRQAWSAKYVQHFDILVIVVRTRHHRLISKQQQKLFET
jgi:hypothetical protein